MFVLISGVFIARGKEDALVTKNLVPGNTVYGEKKIQVEVWLMCCKICLTIDKKFSLWFNEILSRILEEL